MAALVILVIAIVVLIYERFHYQDNWNKNLIVRISLDRLGVKAGEEFHLDEVIINDKNMHIPVMEVKFSTDVSFIFNNKDNAAISDKYYRRDVFDIKGYKKITRRHTVVATKRGVYDIGDIDVISYDFLMQLKYMTLFKNHAEIMVYPERIDTRDFRYIVRSIVGDNGKKGLIEDEFLFRGMREYVPGDPIKRINQKTSARQGKYMVNQMECVSTQRFIVIHDADPKDYRDGELIQERGISVSVSFVENLYEQGYDVSYRSNLKTSKSEEDVCVDNVCNRERMLAIDKKMAVVDTSVLVKPLEKILDETYSQHGRGVSYIVVTSRKASDVNDILRDYINKGVSICAVIPYTKREVLALFNTENPVESEHIYPWNAV